MKSLRGLLVVALLGNLACNLVSSFVGSPTQTVPVPPSAEVETAAVPRSASSTPSAAANSAETPEPLQPQPNGAVTPVTGHPRLWLRADDLPRLRAWAVETNPVYQDGLARVVEAAKADMDQGNVPGKDPGTVTYVDYPSEMYAELFAFMALVGPAGQRDGYAERAHVLLMHVMNEAAKGQAEGRPFRDPRFAVDDRSRWYGEGFALTVDWIYPYLTPQDKATIHTVFLRWANENLTAEVTSFNHPEPVGLVNDPALYSDSAAARFALNNYYTAHARNIALMALALDPTDDTDGKLRPFVDNATGAWLYVIDHELRTDARGGLAPEGFEYGPQTLAFVAQLLLALHTAGEDDAARRGPQVVQAANPFWNDMVTAYFHSLSPAPVDDPQEGLRYLPAWYGDGQRYYVTDPISTFAPVGLYDLATGNTAQLSAIRWLAANIPSGGALATAARAGSVSNFREAIFYFLLFDPAAPPAADPRPALPLTHLAAGIGHLLARTSWGPEAAWFQYYLGWNGIDHQMANGNHFGFYRHGEWLTKDRTGYANIAEGIASSEFQNTVALENDKPDQPPDDWRYDLWQRGSQWNLVVAGDPNLVATGDGQTSTGRFTYAEGDATNLYNSLYENSTDILHASRSIVWLQPDYVVVYDRAESKTAGRFKRFWLQLPEQAQIAGNRATMRLPSGQQLFVTALLPANAALTAVNTTDQVAADAVAADEPMRYRLKVEAPGGPAAVRFLHVLQGADAGVLPAPVSLVQSDSGTPFAGVIVANRLVLFPVSLDIPFARVTYSVPANVTVHLITGLAPNQSYAVLAKTAGDKLNLTITPGRGASADSGGVLVWDSQR
jgi:hypothetical protein